MASGTSRFGTLRRAGAVLLFPFLGVDRKWSEGLKSVAFDPEPMCDLLTIADGGSVFHTCAPITR
jgi:hypothetical protein